jgi:predicted enzyme related to lactoylglutathione lyase
MGASRGQSNWFDLPAVDIVDAMSFYEGLLGWKFLKLGDDAVPDYWVIQAGNEMIGGLRQTPAGSLKKDGAAPVIYFTVEVLEPAVKRARDLGAEIVGEKVVMGDERGRYQWLRDRQENLIALWAPK